MINNLEGKSKRELIEIVQIQMDEYAKLQKERDELRANIELIADICTRDGNSEIFRIAARTKGSLDELKLEQQVKGIEDYGNLTLFPSMGDGFSGDFCSGFEAALSHALTVAKQLRQQVSK